MIVCPGCARECSDADRFCPSCGFPIGELSRGSDDPLIGRTLPGGYVILELIGVGGMGRVYRGEQQALGRTVAVKVIHSHLLGDESAGARFITEARAASRLNHPNSVGVIDFGKTDQGAPYLVMEFLRGRDLARVLYDEGPLPLRRVIDIVRQVLLALGEAHELGIIHRDLKPENIILEPMRGGGDFVKVVDFGLAKMRAEPTARNVTQPGIVCGTPDYMAPEQGRGDALDPRADLYAVGVILFLLLTNRLPFDLAEAEAELVAGYHTEYSAFKFGMFFMGEYANLVAASALIVTLYFGGWSLPGVSFAGPWGALASVAVFFAKTLAFVALFIWVRWTFPRFRYDQLMSLGWKVLLPLSFFHLIAVAAFVAAK